MRTPKTSDHPLYRLRCDRGWSREQLAVRAGLSSRTLFAIEREGVRPQRATRAVLASALGCDPDNLGPAANRGPGGLG